MEILTRDETCAPDFKGGRGEALGGAAGGVGFGFGAGSPLPATPLRSAVIEEEKVATLSQEEKTPGASSMSMGGLGLMTPASPGSGLGLIVSTPSSAGTAGQVGRVLPCRSPKLKFQRQ